jgi:hypothetical protein
LPRLVRLAAPAAAATVVTGTIVGAAVAWPDGSPDPVAGAQLSRGTPLVAPDAAGTREEAVSRSARRVTLEPKPKKKQSRSGPETVPRSEIVDHLFMTTALNVWSGPGEQHTLLDVLPAGTKVPVTGEVVDGAWAEISYDGLSRWVNAAYLAETKPRPEPEPTGLSDAPCPSGSEVENGLTPDAVLVHRAVCAAFPQVTSYGGVRPDGEHSQGLALDIMVSGSSLGDQIAEYVRANSGSLGVSEVIWAQRIWTVERSGDGWRWMEDRGSTTANHYDHVHVTVYGSSGG